MQTQFNPSLFKKTSLNHIAKKDIKLNSRTANAIDDSEDFDDFDDMFVTANYVESYTHSSGANDSH